MPASDFKDRFKGRIGAFGADGKIHPIVAIAESQNVYDADENAEKPVEEKIVGNRALLQQLMVFFFPPEFDKFVFRVHPRGIVSLGRCPTPETV